jgi:hypothetical protein
MKIYATAKGLVADSEGRFRLLPASVDLDALFSDTELLGLANRALARSRISELIAKGQESERAARTEAR